MPTDHRGARRNGRCDGYSVPEITIDTLIDRSAVLLLDAYGILVNSSGALPGAAGLIETLNRLGKPYYATTPRSFPRPRPARYGGYGPALDAACRDR